MAADPIPPPTHWCLTGVAGFIGSHLLEELLRRDHSVTGLDNLATGKPQNLADVQQRVSPAQWARFRFIHGDIRHPADLEAAVAGADVVLHQAALGSVPQSLAEPARTHDVNVTGFVHLLEAARKGGVRRIVYASSSAVYGDCTELPSREDRIGAPLSPYGLSKRLNEEYAALFERCYGLSTIGLRYFNVFGPRQDPQGAYAAVIPRWIAAFLADQPVDIYGDGETSRDFCPVDGVVRANLLAASATLTPTAPRVYNVGLGQTTSLNQLAEGLRQAAGRHRPSALANQPRHTGFREGDIRHSRAEVGAARHWLGFEPDLSLAEGFQATVDWYGSRP